MRSMTGYSKCLFEDDQVSLKMEIKSVNNKNLNLKIKSPYFLNFLENSIRLKVASFISRGSIDLRIDLTDKQLISNQFSCDKDIAMSYMKILDGLEETFSQKFTNKMDLLIRNFDVIQRKDIEVDEDKYTKVIMPQLERLLSDLVIAKENEGNRLRAYFLEKIAILESKIAEIKKYKDQVVINYKNALIERLEKVKNDITISKEDILKEILLFTDKSDISEELSRLDSHITQLKQDIALESNTIGKKIDFILQEIFRELNTAGVKSNMYEISKLIVDCKNELEKIREQAMNIE